MINEINIECYVNFIKEENSEFNVIQSLNSEFNTFYNSECIYSSIHSNDGIFKINQDIEVKI